MLNESGIPIESSFPSEAGAFTKYSLLAGADALALSEIGSLIEAGILVGKPLFSGALAFTEDGVLIDTGELMG